MSTNTQELIGREWNSPYGRQLIERIDHWGGQDYYVVKTIETGAIRIYPASRIEEIIRRDEYELTPECAAERAEAEEIRKLRAERDAREAAKKAKELSEIAEFTNGMSAMAAGRVRKTLLIEVNSRRYGIINRKRLVEQLIQDGARMGSLNGRQILDIQDGSFHDDESLTKAGMQYAAYMIGKKL